MSRYQFQIGGLNLDKLSGPVSVAVLTPTSKAISSTRRKLPVFLLLGDYHKSFANMCETTNQIYPSTMSKNWYNLLDSVASKEQPIDYFVESAYVLKILNQYNMFSLMLKEGYEKPTSVMSYFYKNYLWCFSADPKLNHCFTKNIRYHFADIRTSHNTLIEFTLGNIKDNIESFNSEFEKYPFVPYE